MRFAHSVGLARCAHRPSPATAAPDISGTRGAPHDARRLATASAVVRRTARMALLLSVVALAGCAGKQQIVIEPEATHPQARQQPSSAPSQALVRTARSALGVPYRSGGRTPAEGFDCSGFVWWSFYQQGINLPRTTEEQAACGSAVPPGGELRPADIIVFRTGSGPLGLHTAIYTGGGQFVHSPKPGGTVREESLTVRYWQRAFISARRILRPAEQDAAGLP